MKLTYKNGKYKATLIDRLFNLFKKENVSADEIFYYDIELLKNSWYEPTKEYNVLAGVAFDTNEVALCWRPIKSDGVEMFELALKRNIKGKVRYFIISKLFKEEEITLEMFLADESTHERHKNFEYDFAINVNIEVYAVNGNRRFNTHRAVLFYGDKPSTLKEIAPQAASGAKEHKIQIFGNI